MNILCTFHTYSYLYSYHGYVTHYYLYHSHQVSQLFYVSDNAQLFIEFFLLSFNFNPRYEGMAKSTTCLVLLLLIMPGIGWPVCILSSREFYRFNFLHFKYRVTFHVCFNRCFFHWRLRASLHHASRTLLSILTVLDSDVVWMAPIFSILPGEFFAPVLADRLLLEF